jgi:hypothetical protein
MGDAAGCAAYEAPAAMPGDSIGENRRRSVRYPAGATVCRAKFSTLMAKPAVRRKR